MKPVIIIAIAIVLLFIPLSVFAEISYPTNSQRLKELPTYCIVEPSGLTASNRGQYINLAVKGVSEWNTKLQGYESINPAIWKINSKIISSSDSTNNCSIVMYFQETVQQLHTDGKTTTIGIFRGSSQSIEIAFKNLNVGKIYNIIIHEIGHSLGLGHYVSDDDEVNTKW